MGWKVIARYEVGISHQKLDLPCQDFADFRILDDVIIGAVADGAGSAKYSDIGAKLAVEVVLEYLTEFSQLFQKRIQKRREHPNFTKSPQAVSLGLILRSPSSGAKNPRSP